MATAAAPREPRLTAGDLEQDLDLVRAAISLIAAGGADRITLIGLKGAERVLPRAQALCLEAGLRARAERHPGDAGCDILVEGIR
jgi:hypothetical protein